MIFFVDIILFLSSVLNANVFFVQCDDWDRKFPATILEYLGCNNRMSMGSLVFPTEGWADWCLAWFWCVQCYTARGCIRPSKDQRTPITEESFGGGTRLKKRRPKG
jgi:hypothetical protein